MSNDFFDFAQTKDALSQLSADLIGLESLVKIKKEELDSARQEVVDFTSAKEQQISSLCIAVDNALNKIENIENYINGVL